MGAYSGYPPPATIPSFQGTAGTWRNDGPLGTRLVLNELSYLDSAAGGTRYRTTGGIDYLVVGDLSGGNTLYRSLTPPAAFPGWDTNNLYGFGYGTWYNDGPQGLRLVLGDTYAQPTYLTRNIERYTYNLEGYLTQVTKQTQQAIRQFGVETVQGVPSAAELVSETGYNGLGWLTSYSEYKNGAAVFNRFNISYNVRGQITSETSSLIRAKSETDSGLATFTSYITNQYDAATGLQTGTTTTSYRNNDNQGTSQTSLFYTYWDGAVQDRVTYRPDTSKNTTYESTYTYNRLGHLASVYIADGRVRTVTFVNDAAGQVLSRYESSSSAKNPTTHYYYYNGVLLGSNGTNGNDYADYAEVIKERTTPQPNAPGAFRNGAKEPIIHADFDQAYDPINPNTPGGSPQSYTVRGGETLESVASLIWGDPSLWYMIAEANGLSSSSQISAGQVLIIPNKVANFHNNATTFRPYDASNALGDTQPTTPKPPKKPSCIKVLVSVIVKVVASYFLGPLLGNVVGQGVDNLLGLQKGFSFKSLALSVISAGVAGGFEGAIGTSFLAKAAEAALANAVTQGIGVVTGLQKKFSFTSVAVAGVSAGVTEFVSTRIGGGIGSTYKDAAGNTQVRTVPTLGNEIVTGMAGAIAAGATRALIDGTSFGRAVLEELPSVLGNLAGKRLAHEFGAPVYSKRGDDDSGTVNANTEEKKTFNFWDAIRYGPSLLISKGVRAAIGGVKDAIRGIAAAFAPARPVPAAGSTPISGSGESYRITATQDNKTAGELRYSTETASYGRATSRLSSSVQYADGANFSAYVDDGQGGGGGVGGASATPPALTSVDMSTPKTMTDLLTEVGPKLDGVIARGTALSPAEDDAVASYLSALAKTESASADQAIVSSTFAKIEAAATLGRSDGTAKLGAALQRVTPAGEVDVTLDFVSGAAQYGDANGKQVFTMSENLGYSFVTATKGAKQADLWLLRNINSNLWSPIRNFGDLTLTQRTSALSARAQQWNGLTIGNIFAPYMKPSKNGVNTTIRGVRLNRIQFKAALRAGAVGLLRVDTQKGGGSITSPSEHQKLGTQAQNDKAVTNATVYPDPDALSYVNDLADDIALAATFDQKAEKFFRFEWDNRESDYVVTAFKVGYGLGIKLGDLISELPKGSVPPRAFVLHTHDAGDPYEPGPGDASPVKRALMPNFVLQDGSATPKLHLVSLQKGKKDATVRVEIYDSKKAAFKQIFKSSYSDQSQFPQ